MIAGITPTGFQGDSCYAPGDVWGSLPAQGGHNGGGPGGIALAFGSSASGDNLSVGDNLSPTFKAGHGGNAMAVCDGLAARRLTPIECERLQGFPDDFTMIEYRGRPASDAPRYKALGNSWAVPVGAWIIRRIQEAMP